MANLFPRNMAVGKYIGDHSILLHTKYISFGPPEFKEDFKSFYHYKSMETLCYYANLSAKTLCSLSPYLMMLYMKFNDYQPTDFRDNML